MDYILTYNYCAIFNLLIIIITFYSKRYIPNQQNRLYSYLIWVSFLGTVVDIMSSMGSNHPLDFSLVYLNLTNYGYYILHNLMPFIFCVYTLALGGIHYRDIKPAKKAAIFLPIIITLLFIFSTPFTQGVFYIDSNGNHFRGRYLFILYLIAFYYLAYSIIYTAFCKDVIPAGAKKAIFAFITLNSAAVILQIFYPRHLIENFAISVSTIIMFLAIQKPEELIDASTGVLNRNSFTDTLKLCFKHKEFINICIIHIEDIGMLTKAFGIENTDKIVREAAQYLEIKNKNRVFDLHFHTFGIVYKQMDESLMSSMVQELLERFKQPWEWGNVKITLSVRACIVCIPKDASSIDRVFEYIEQFSQVKQWKSEVVSAKNIDLRDKTRETQVERAVERAIKNKSFEVFYQPIYSNEKERFISAEALIRLNDSRLGRISPDEFIPIAEKDGSIIAIGRFVFEEVCRLLHKYDLSRFGIDYIQVNLSVIQCMQENMANELIEIMKLYNIKADRVRLEITETAAANSPRMLHENMNRLYEEGIRFALDDFGTGYSNINSLADLPLDTIKIDKSMVWAAAENKKAKIILESSVAMIKKMKMRIVAEGIETKEQAEELKSLGCDCLQGYYFSKPVPCQSFLELLKAKAE